MRKPKTGRREALWLEAVNQVGWTVQDLMRATGLAKSRIYEGLKRARSESYDLPTIWDIEWISTPNVFIQAQQCQWHAGQPIPDGLRIGCLSCLRAGLETLISRHGKPLEDRKQSEDQPKGTPAFIPRLKRAAPRP